MTKVLLVIKIRRGMHKIVCPNSGKPVFLIRFLPVILFLTTFLLACSGNDTNIPQCPNSLIFFDGQCVESKHIEREAVSDLEELDRLPDNRAMTDEEVQEFIGPIFTKYLLDCPSYQVHHIFGDAILKRAGKRDERGLRILLDMRYYQDKYSNVVFAEISEGWRDEVIFFIEEDTDLVIKVASDQNQLNKKVIDSAFIQFVDVFSVDQTTGEITDKRLGAKHKELMQLIEKQRYNHK